MTEPQMTPRKFSRGFKFKWALASFGESIISGVYGALLLYFYQTYLGLAASWIGLAAWIYGIWNAINDPLFGFLSDSTKSKRGRRIPYLRFTAPFLGLTFILVFLVPVNFAQEELFWWALITMLAYDTCYTLVGLVYSALLPEVTESDQERGELQKYSSVLYLLGLVIGFLVPDYLRPKVGDPSLVPLYVGVIGVGIFGAITILITSFNVKERPEFTLVDKPLGFRETFAFTFTSKAGMLVIVANFFSLLMQQILLGSMFYLADYVLHVDTIVCLAMIILGLLLGTLFANKIATKIGVVQTEQVLLLISGIPLVLLTFAPTELIYLCLPFAGFGIAGPLVLTNVLTAQAADEDEIRTGVRREAAFFGVMALISKPAQSLAIFLAAWLIEGAGFIPANGGPIVLNQPAAVPVAIRILVGLIPGLAMLAGSLLLTWYPLRGTYLKEIQQKVLVMHAEKATKLKLQQGRPA